MKMVDKKQREKVLAKMLSIIQKNPGIRPREIHKKLNLEHSWNLRSALIKKGLARKNKKGNAVYYYPKN